MKFEEREENLQPLEIMAPFILFSSVQSLGRVRLFATPWTTAHQASLFILLVHLKARASTRGRENQGIISVHLIVVIVSLVLWKPCRLDIWKNS